MADPAASAIYRRELHCLVAGLLLAIGSVALVGAIYPWQVVSVQSLEGANGVGILDIVSDLGATAAVLVVVLGSYSVGWFGWALIVQRRRPWPLGRKRPEEQLANHWSHSVIPVAAGAIAIFVSHRSFREDLGLSVPPIDGYWIRMTAPVDLAIDMVVFLTVASMIAIPGQAILVGALRQWNPTSDPLRLRVQDGA